MKREKRNRGNVKEKGRKRKDKMEIEVKRVNKHEMGRNKGQNECMRSKNWHNHVGSKIIFGSMILLPHGSANIQNKPVASLGYTQYMVHAL